MLEQTHIRSHPLDSYRPVIGDSLLQELHSLSSHLKGARIAHINATANGGGVAEILHSLIPLYRDLGVDASWLVIEGDDDYFRITKQLHNTLQGAPREIPAADWDTYMRWNRHNASTLSADYDLVFVHDPQPAALLHFVGKGSAQWIWRCHIDTSTPNSEVWRILTEIVSGFDAMVFSVPDFVGPGLQGRPVAIVPPAIDPLQPKNRPLSREKAEAVVAKYGLDPSRPFITQVSRFDPWKDPLGVIAAFELLRERHPDLQLALLGNFADDDPEGYEIYERVVEAAQKVPDVHVITGLTDLVNPFQDLSTVVLQKSLREGFGLTVTEALWKGTPVVAGNVGGIRLQIAEGIGGYLVDTIEECAERVDYLLNQEEARTALGEAGREHVRLNFLLPRLLRDELRLAQELAAAPAAAPVLNWSWTAIAAT